MDTLVSRKPPTGSGPRKPSKETKASHKAFIGRNLKLVYDGIARERLPQKFLDLLDQIEDRQIDDGEAKS